MEPLNIMDTQNTKIIATVGPASSSYEKLLSLIKAGVDVFRLNFSHGTHAAHQQVINHIRYINENYNLHIGILADLQGPKIRIGEVQNNHIPIRPGDILTFVNEKCIGTKEKIYLSYPSFAKDVTIGEKILVDDGKIVLEVLETDKKSTVKLKVIFGNKLSSNKGVNLPHTKISLPSLTEKDLADLQFIFTQPINWIALSFVRSANDIVELKKLIQAADHTAKVIAKIEKPEAVEHIDAIIKVTDGLMIARGDLGIEVPMEKLPAIQKMIIRKSIQSSRTVIVATQMMDSMIENPSPTRAEVTDVANAVCDGTDAVMLSGETSVGKYPVLVVEAMNKILEEAEKNYNINGNRPVPNPDSETFLSDIICFNAAKTAADVNAKAIIGVTTSGYTAFKVSSYRPMKKIYIFSDQPHILCTLNLVWGVRCHYYDKFVSTDETISDVVAILKKRGKLKEGDVVVNTGSMPMEKRYRTNMLKVTVVK